MCNEKEYSCFFLRNPNGGQLLHLVDSEYFCQKKRRKKSLYYADIIIEMWCCCMCIQRIISRFSSTTCTSIIFSSPRSIDRSIGRRWLNRSSDTVRLLPRTSRYRRRRNRRLLLPRARAFRTNPFAALWFPLPPLLRPSRHI